jgi:hypothetical protein
MTKNLDLSWAGYLSHSPLSSFANLAS